MTNKKDETKEEKKDIKQLLFDDMRSRQEACSAEFKQLLGELLGKYDCELDIVSHTSMKAGTSYEIRFIPK